jgi:hypothetical protein
VKYIAKRAAKNMSSLESQTMVPTATMFGRLSRGGVATALVIGGIIPERAPFSFVRNAKSEVRPVRRITQE